MRWDANAFRDGKGKIVRSRAINAKIRPVPDSVNVQKEPVFVKMVAKVSIVRKFLVQPNAVKTEYVSQTDFAGAFLVTQARVVIFQVLKIYLPARMVFG